MRLTTVAFLDGFFAGDQWAAVVGVTGARAIVEPLSSYAAKKVLHMPFKP